MKAGKLKIIMTLILLTVVAACVGVMISSASSNIVTEGEMIDIKNDFSSHLVKDTARIDNDGYVGPLQYTVYYKDKGVSSVVPGINGTPIIVYAINTNTERVGTDSNKTIIQSMLDRGYLVVVLDYLGNDLATGHPLDMSAQAFVNNLKAKKYFNFDGNAKKQYNEVFVAPSGYDVLLNQVFWEVDKHSASGTLEKIVENWNTDFKGTKAERLVKWATGSTVATRKTVENASDGTSPVWYNASGAVDQNGLYTKVKYTVAKTITDCVKPDGSPLDMDLKLHLVYPTNPEKEVPVLSVSCCWGYATNTIACYTDLCAHHTGSLFRGYAGAVYDYFWQPMGRDDAFGYYDGNLNTNGAVTGNHMNYSLHLYNDKLINTAAIRYLRYLALSESETYSFDIDKFCTIGLSKGAWFSFLGEEVLQSGLVNANDYTDTAALETAIDEALASFAARRIFNGHSGETRYQAGESTVITGGTYVGEYAIEPGEKQPWLTYGGTEITSGVQLTYAANGSQQEDISAGHSPIFGAAHMNDEYNASYGSANDLANISKSLDIPFVFFEVDQLHEYAYFPDMFYGVPTYDAFFDFANYYLQNAAVKVYYTDPYKNDGDISLTDKITVQFSGSVTLSEVMKITVTAGGEALKGTWESVYGGTQWIFSPENMKSGTTYTVTVPASLKGDNGVAMGTDYVSEFTTRNGSDTALSATDVSYYTVNAPVSMPSGMDTLTFRFAVSNNAANVAELYAVEGVGATAGELLGSVNLRGAGTYEIDITKYLLDNASKSVTLMLKAGKTAGVSTLADRDFSTNANVKTYADAPYSIVKLDENGNESASGDAAIKVYVKNNEGRYGGGDVFYENVTTVLGMQNLLGTNAISKADYGRQIEITVKVFDTTSRTLQLKLNGMTSSSTGVMDYDIPLHNITTVAGEWMTITIPYVVYDTDYGKGSSTTKTLFAAISPTGDSEMPIYFSNLTVRETVTEMNVTEAYLSVSKSGRAPYKAPESDKAFALYNGSNLVGSYDTWKAALGAYASGYTLKLTSDYTLTNNDVWGDFGAKADKFVIDLNGYTIYSENTSNALLWLKTTSKSIAKTSITIQNGGIVLNSAPLISYESSTAQGSGKAYDVTLQGVKITLGAKAMLTELISSSSIPASSSAEVNITLDECDIDLGDEDNRAIVMLTLMPEGKGTLKLSYTVKGGSLTMSHPRWITVQNKATYVDYLEGNDGNMKLYLPAAYAPSIKVSYITAKGYSQYAAKSTVNNVTEYALELAGEGSTRYGIIPDAYLNSETYPFVLFRDGAFVGAYSTWNSALNTAQTNAGGSDKLNTEIQIVLRRDYKNLKDAGPQINRLTNLVVDLGGHTFISEDVGLDFSASYAAAPYETNIRVENGKILAGRIAFVDGQLFAAATGVKVYNLDFVGVTFGFDSGIGDFWGDMIYTPWTAVASSVGMQNNITYENCVFDLTNYPLNKNYTVFNTSDGNRVLNVDMTFIGGEILMDSASYLTFAKLDANDSIRVAPDAGGNYITLKAKSGVAPISTNFIDENGKNRSFTLDSDNGTTAVYTLDENPLATEYGVIGTAYADVNAYPFALFSEGSFVGGYSTFSAAIKDGSSKCSGTSHEYVILMRRDYTVNQGDSSYLSDLNGKLTLDLGGYKIFANWYLFDQYVTTGNLWAVNGKFTVKNGAMVRSGEIPMFGMNQGSNTSEHKKFDITFENIKFSTTHSSGNGIIFDCWDNNNLILDTKLTFTDCTFDFTGASKGAVMIKAGSSKNYTDMDITVKGGSIIADRLSNYGLYNLGKEDTCVFEKNADGKYTTLTTLTTAAYSSEKLHYEGTFETPEGEMYFIEIADDGVRSTYELGRMSFEYGKMSLSENKLLSAVDFPFVLFFDGAYKGGYGTWRQAIDGAKGWVKTAGTEGKTVYIVQRRDYDAVGSKDSGSNFNEVRGNIVLDLNGFTVTNIDNYFIDIYVNYNNTAILGYKSSIEFKNGTLLNARTGAPMIAIGHTGKNASYGTKQFSFTFTNVTFKVASGVSAIITEWTGNPHVGGGTDVDYFFDGCTFDFNGAKASSTFFNILNTYSHAKIVVRGGNIVADSFAGHSLYKTTAEDVSYIAPDASGKYMTLTQLSHVAAPGVSFKNEAGKTLSFGKDHVEGLYAVYVIGEPSSTKYGDIPYQYYSKEDYPFAVFDEKGNFIGAYESLLDCTDPYNNNGAVNFAKDYMSGNTWNGSSYGASPRAAYILMRRDYKFASNEAYNNLAQVQGVLTIDLNGFTLTAANDRVMFSSSIKPWVVTGDSSIFPTEFFFINGTIEIVNKALINFEPWGTKDNIDVSGKAFNYRFDNVVFKAIGKATTIFATTSTSADTPNALAYPELIFNNCTFDITGAVSGATVFSLGNGLTNIKITVNGGEIIAGDKSFKLVTKSDATTTKLVFTKSEDGNYTTITLPKSVNAPEGEFDVDGGKAVFVKVSENADTVTYRLRNSATVNVDFTPKMSITLDNEFVVNVYVPVNKDLQNLVIDGKTYGLEALKSIAKTNVDGTDYYVFKIALGSSEAASEITLAASFDLGENTARASYTFSIPKYAEKLINGGNDVEKTLARDVLAYIRAAYEYFTEHNEKAEIERVSALIDAIIGDYEAVPTSSGATNTAAPVKSVTLDLDARPTVRFYVTDTAVEFYASGKKLNTVTGTDTENGAYVELDVYAYALAETITYEGGSYHISDFVGGSVGTSHEALVNAFAKYVESAADYRRAVIAD